jgi:hypothetical protein
LVHRPAHRQEAGATRRFRYRSVPRRRRIGNPVTDRVTDACPALAERTPDITSPDYGDLHVLLLFRFPEPMTGSGAPLAKSAVLERLIMDIRDPS